MYFEVLQPGKALTTDGTLVGFLVGVRADVDQHLVPIQETRVVYPLGCAHTKTPHSHTHTHKHIQVYIKLRLVTVTVLTAFSHREGRWHVVQACVCAVCPFYSASS